VSASSQCASSMDEEQRCRRRRLGEELEHGEGDQEHVRCRSLTQSEGCREGSRAAARAGLDLREVGLEEPGASPA
jgi:hypothetical protein